MLRSDVFTFTKHAAEVLGSAFSTLGSMGSNRRISPLRRAPLRPTGKALRNPADPFQAERIHLAKEKRQSKAAKLHSDSVGATTFNRAHIQSPKHYRLNPFYINR